MQTGSETNQDAPEDPRLCLVYTPDETHGRAPLQRRRKEPRHTVELSRHVDEKPFTFISESTTTPRAAIAVSERPMEVLEYLGLKVFIQKLWIPA